LRDHGKDLHPAERRIKSKQSILRCQKPKGQDLEGKFVHRRHDYHGDLYLDAVLIGSTYCQSRPVLFKGLGEYFAGWIRWGDMGYMAATINRLLTVELPIANFCLLRRLTFEAG
jgi:hypothetical protein